MVVGLDIDGTITRHPQFFEDDPDVLAHVDKSVVCLMPTGQPAGLLAFLRR